VSFQKQANFIAIKACEKFNRRPKVDITRITPDLTNQVEQNTDIGQIGHLWIALVVYQPTIVTHKPRISNKN